MAGTNIGQHVSPASEDLPALQRCEALTARRARRIRLLVLTVTASVLAIVAISAGLPSTGLAIYLAATLPFAFFS
ncbi:hypothetical protein [Paraburkholderia phenazinium]|jgi:fatty acid desaturase|uniref:Uncharacterized protein n=1 Tax=Paraburkholderia phenazinium TaxID=60549 RepID=A0A1G8FCA7_9BURK|nr:hypothetical protein [Paraburkholderia phenazinium]SDH79733.1 hypothetical protein SAMN05216466_113127 [Paraburkholderia phenazinium]